MLILLGSCGSGGGEEPAGKCPPPVSRSVLSDAELAKNLACSSKQFAASANRRFQFQKRSQLFIRSHNETLPVAAMRVSNPGRSPAGINR
jgi:hypothetical protein